jgi:hypothetical protein
MLMPMTNSQILNYGEGQRTRLLTEIERQTLFCLKVALTPAPCPACHSLTNQVEASGKALDDFDATGTTKHEFHCPHCKRRLVEIVPFIASGPKYQWRLADPLPPV